MAPGITEIQNATEFDNIMKGLRPQQLLVIDFHATWCGPCHAIAPFQHVKFVKVDVDRNQQLAQRYRVSAMPTFKFIKGGNVVDELRGASPPQLNAKVAQHAGPVPPVSAGGSSSTTTTTSTSTIEPGPTSLLSHITSKDLTCLNESSTHPLRSIIGPDSGPKGSSYLESDVDPELLIGIPFNDTVKLKSIVIFGGVSPNQAPKTIKLYINQNHMDFSDCETLEPAQILELKGDDIRGGNKIDLRFVRFQNVRSLYILIKDNQDDEETTRIDSIDIFGTTADTSDRGPLKSMEHAH